MKKAKEAPKTRGTSRERQQDRRRRFQNQETVEFLCPLCGKVCYRSRTQARKAAARKHPGTQMREYECDKKGSGRWHFTSQSSQVTERYRTWRASGYRPYATEENTDEH